MSLIRINRARDRSSVPQWTGALAGLALLAFVAVAQGQVSVQTIGGGPRTECGHSYGFAEGNTWMHAQFDVPYATALDSQGNLWVADLDNADIEEVTEAGNRTSSLTYEYASGSNKHPFPDVIGMAVDGSDNLYVLTTTTLFKFEDVTESFPDLNLLFEIPLDTFSTAPASAITVVNDASTNIYISFTSGSVGTIIRIPQPYGGSYSTVVNNYAFAPSGLSIRQDGQLAVSDVLNDGIYVVATADGSTPVLITGGIGPGYVNGSPGFAKFNQPHGIAASADGRMVVCDTMNNYLRLIDTNNNTTTLYGTPTNVWTGTCCSCSPAIYAGWVDGTAGTTTSSASGREPLSVTIAPSGGLFVTEEFYNLIRSVTGSGLTPVTSITSISTSTNVPTVITLAATGVTTTGGTLNASVDPNGSPTTVFFQWGTTTNLGSNTTSTLLSTDLGASNAVAVALTGLLVNTIIYYQAVAINNGGTSTGGLRSFITSTVSAQGLTISPSSGYFPECQTITVTSPVQNVYYTEDGSTPTTNSPQVVMTTNSGGQFVGTFQWCNAQADLSTLQVVTASGGVITAEITGTSPTTNQLGFVRSSSAGIGSTAYIPIVLDLQNGAMVESLQFRVEVAPNGSAPPITSLSLLPITSNDFVQLIGPSPGNAPINLTVTPYTNTVSSNGQGLLVYTVGPGTGLDIQNFGVVGLLQIPIPYNASTNQSYSLSVFYPSATAVGGQIGVQVGAMLPQTLTVADLPYLAGDSAPAYGYDAEEFGDGILDNRDVNNAIYASMGVRVPPLYSDAFNAMDVYPQTPTENGDGLIQYQDWNTILLRSVGLDTPNWIRFWTNGGVLFGETTTNGLAGDPAVPTEPADAAVAQVSGTPPGLVWLCPASIGAGTVTNLAPGKTCSLPVYASVLAGYSLSGLQFRAIVSANGNAPPVGRVLFTPAEGIPSPMSLPGQSVNDVLTAWTLGDFSTPLQNSNYIGAISFQIPATAQSGQSYAVHFIGVDGAPDSTTDYAMESFPGCAWVLSTALQPASITSDEWKLHFFGSLTSSLAGDQVDADGDGAPNWQEYLAGTDPTNPRSVFQFGSAGFSSNGVSGVALGWLTAPGKTYILETIPAMGGNNWTAINTNAGDGYPYQFIQNKFNGNAEFYRILLQP